MNTTIGFFHVWNIVAADTAWTPLLATPSYPSHGGNVACLSAAAARALQLAHGRDDIPFTITNPARALHAPATLKGC